MQRSVAIRNTFPDESYPHTQDVRSHSTFRIPIIDFSAFRANTAPAEKRRVADDIVNGFKEAGFVYLSGHGIPEDVIDNVYKKVRPWRVNWCNLKQFVECSILWSTTGYQSERSEPTIQMIRLRGESRIKSPGRTPVPTEVMSKWAGSASHSLPMRPR